MRSRLALLVAFVAACTGSKPAPSACVKARTFSATGFFRVAWDCGRPLLVDPSGKPFFSFGVNHLQWEGDAARDGTNPYHAAVVAKYGTEDAWAKATAARLRAWGWNTAGAWSSDSIGELMPYTVNLSLSGANWQTGSVPDYFDPAWVAGVKAAAASGAASHAQDHNLVGYFIDNEMHWGPDWRTSNDLFDDFFALSASAPGKQALVELMEDRHHGSIADFNAAWGSRFASFDALGSAKALNPGITAAAHDDRSAFISLAADQFFQVTAGAIRAADPHHLVLGVRFVAAFVPLEVAAAAGKYCDVVSANDYEFVTDPQSAMPAGEYGFVDLSAGPCLEGLYEATKKPILISEFGWRAKDSGLPNTYPPIYPTLATQSDRADRFEKFARACLGSPWMVGYHWFEWADEPAAGRFDGENDNWGLVDSDDEPYTAVTDRTRQVNVWPWP